MKAWKFIIITLVLCLAVSAFAEDTKKAIMYRLTAENYKDYFPKIGIALGGGSAKGFAHLGVLRVLKDKNIPVHYIAGTSMGSIMGGLYSCGYTVEEIRDIAKSIDYEDVFDDMVRDKPASFSRGSLNNPTLFRFPEEGPVGINSGRKVQKILRKWTLAPGYKAHFDFDKLPTKLRIVSTDFLTGKKVVFDSGPLDRAMRASASIPFIFKPLAYKNTYLVDGAAVEVVPIDEVRKMQADIVIGVNVARALPMSRDKITSPISFSEHLFDVLVETGMDKNFGRADILIDIPPTTALTSDDYTNFDKFIAYGEDHVKKYIDKIEKKIAENNLKQDKYILKKVTIEGLDRKQNIFETDLAYTNLEIVRKLYPLLEEYGLEEALIYLIPIQDDDYELKIVFQTERAPKIKKIAWQGNQAPFPKALAEKINEYRGINYSKDISRRIEKLINEYYQSEGYILVDLASEYKTGELVIDIYEVPIVKVTFSGNEYTSTDVIKSLMRFELPEVYNSNKVERAIQKLYATELFEQVEIEVEREKDGVLLNFELVERPYGIFYANAQYFSSQNKVELDFGHKNNYTFGHRFKSYLSFVTGPEYDLNFGLSGFNVFDTGLGFGYDYLKHQEEVPIYDKHHRGEAFWNDQEINSVFLEYWFLNYNIASLTYAKRRQYLQDQDKEKFPGYFQDVFLTELDFKWDTLEKDYLAAYGGNLLLHNERNDALPYQKSFAKSTLAFNIKKDTSINWKNYMGLSSGKIFYYDNFFLRRRWLPYGFADLEAEGPNIYYSRLSYRFPCFEVLRGEIGLDLFRSWYTLEDVIHKFENTGAGLGLHYDSFMGLASIIYTTRNDGNTVVLFNLSNEFEE